MWHVAGDAALDRPLRGSGAGTFLDATILDQRDRRHITRSRTTCRSRSLPSWWARALVVLALYAGADASSLACEAIVCALAGRSAVAAFLASNAVDWTWHLAGVGVVFAAALGTLAVAGVEPSSAAVARR